VIKQLILIFLLLINGNVVAREWTDEEKFWAVASTVVTVGDWATTRDMTRRYNQNYYEHNLFLGKHPSTGKVDGYFAISIPLILVVADQLDEYRKPWLISITAIEAIMVGHNLHIGLKLQF
jgi:hypothetical protein